MSTSTVYSRNPVTAEVTEVAASRVSCDGGGGADASPLGHPLVWLAFNAEGVVDCPYCGRRFIQKKGA